MKNYVTKSLPVTVIEFDPSKKYEGIVTEADIVRNSKVLSVATASAFNVAKRMMEKPNTFGAVNVAKIGREPDWVLISKGEFVVKYPNKTADVFSTRSELETTIQPESQDEASS